MPLTMMTNLAIFTHSLQVNVQYDNVLGVVLVALSRWHVGLDCKLSP